MSASPRLDAPDPVTSDRSGDPPPTPPHDDRPRRNRVPRRIAAAGLVVALLGGGFAIQQVIEADRVATANEQRAARTELASDLGAVRGAVADPARDGQNSASALLRHQLLVVAGESPDPELGDRLVEELRTAADELEAASTTPLPERPQVLPVATVDPIYARLAGLEAQAAELAGTYRTAADSGEQTLAALRDLEAAAIGYAESSEELPAEDDPDAVADAWRAEQDRFDGYASAIETAADDATTAPLADAHAQLLTGMRELADDALARLEDGDLDGYNELLTERLEDDDPLGFSTALEEARAEASEDAIDGPLETARARGLGLLTELEELRRITPAQLAEVR